MVFFPRGPTIELSTFFGEYYDTHVFRAPLHGVDIVGSFWEAAFASIAEVDGRFSAPKEYQFHQEMTIVHLELIGLALQHSTNAGDLAPLLEVFTRSYLRESDRSETWIALEPYNRAVAVSCTYPCDPNTPAGRARIGAVNKLRADSFDRWVKQGFDADCATRAANRIGTLPVWDDSVLPAHLISTLITRLAIEDLNDEGAVRLHAILHGLYSGARERVGSANIVATRGAPIRSGSNRLGRSDGTLGTGARYWLRWLAVLPGAFAAAMLSPFPLHWILYLTLSKFIEPYPQLPERTLTPFVLAGVFVLAGSRIAPGRERDVSVLLFGLSLAWMAGIVLLPMSGQAWYSSADFTLRGPLMWLGGAIAGLYLARKHRAASPVQRAKR